MRASEHRCEEAAGKKMQRLPPAGEFERAPGCSGPAVVELPVECTHAARPLAAVMLHARLHAARLVELRKVDELVLILREAVAARNVVENDLVAGAVLLVVLHHRPKDIAVVLRRTE